VEGGAVSGEEEILNGKIAGKLADKLAAVRAEEEFAKIQESVQQPAVVKSGAWLREQRFAPLRWAVPLVVPEGLTIISGSPKAGKSFLVLAWAMAIASGRSPTGFPAQPVRPVLYLALEDGDRRMQSQCADLGFGWIPDLFDYVTEAYPAQVILTATAWLEAHPDGVVIIDTLAKVRPARLSSETSYDHDYRTMGTYHALAKQHPGAAVVIVHHTRTDQSGDFLDSTSGTYGISGAVDTVLVLARKRGETSGVLHATGRDVDENEYRVVNFPFWELDGGTPQAARLAARQEGERRRLGDRSAAILDYAQARGQITTAQAAEILGVSSDQASAYLSRQVQAGRLNRSARGLFVSCIGSVGTVGSVGDSQQSQQTQQVIQENGAVIYDWEALHRMAAHDAA
jgi:AAA domain